MSWISFIGGAAALLTSLSYLPQVVKAWPKGSTDDLSLKTLTALTSGLALWITYGFFKEDFVLIVANFVAATLSGIVMGLKIRDAYLLK